MHTLFAICLSGAAALAQPVQLQPLWTTTGLPNPESVLLAPDGASLFVSNVNGAPDVRDGNGGIARVSLDGTIIEPDWATGLHAPKGMAIAAGRLFASDIDALAEIDLADGRLVARHPADHAGFLNDVAVAPDGAVLASDSARSRIYAWRDGAMSTWLEHDLLRAVNGLLPEATRLVVSTMQGRLLAVDWVTREISVLAEGLGDADGIAALGEDRYLVSEWPGRLFVVEPDGSHSVLLDTREEKRYLNDFLLVGDKLYIPNIEPGALRAYRVLRD